MNEDLKTRFKPGESGNKNRIGGLQIVSRKPDVGQVFEADAKKWRAIHRAGLGGGWNKNGFFQKMAAGHVMDEETARRYLVVACLNALEQIGRAHV